MVDTALTTVGLTSRQEAFAQMVATGSSQTDAYVATYSTTDNRQSARDAASALARRPHVKARIAALRTAIAEQFVINAADLRMRQHEIATAGALVHVRRYNCRHCFASPPRATQWDDAEHFCEAVEAYRASLTAGGKPLPKPLYGGVDYDPFARPNPRCRSCRGVGEAFMYGPEDTTELEGAQAAAYAGASIDARTGTIEIHQHDAQDASRELHRMVPGAMAATRNVNANVNVNIPVPENMSAEAALAFLETLKPS